MKLNSVNINSRPNWLFLAVIALVFPVIFYHLFSAGFIAWDDPGYVVNNKDVHQFAIKNFFTQFYIGNYHPLTMISYAIDWKLFGKQASGYHIENILWHFLNTVLVFYFGKKIQLKPLQAFLLAVIFAFHPLQIESVAWVAERKNLLYAFFFILSLLFYIQYKNTQSFKRLIVVYICFVCSLLAKPSAIVLPLVFILIDVFLFKESFKQFYKRHILFLLLSIGLAIVTLFAQEEDKFINENHAYAINERIGYAGYAILQYVYKFLVPINLSVIYPYPQDKAVSLIIGYATVLLLVFGCYKLYKSKYKLVLYGLLFFVVNLLLVLQFIPFGEVLTADRYMYLPIIGLSIVALNFLPSSDKHLKIISISVVVIFGTLTFMRASVWKNSISLYTDIIKKYPHSFVALNSLGAEHMLNKNYDMSLRYLNAAINENVNYYKGYYNRGLLFAQTERMKDALKDFDKAIELNKYGKAYVARANVYYTLKDFSKAISDAETVLTTEPNNVKAFNVLANCYDDLNQLDKAIFYYNKVIEVSDENPFYFLRRAIVHGKMQQFQLCLQDLEACTNLDANYAEAYYWKGVVKVNMKQNPCADLRKAVDLGFTAAQQPLQTYCR